MSFVTALTKFVRYSGMKTPKINAAAKKVQTEVHTLSKAIFYQKLLFWRRKLIPITDFANPKRIIVSSNTNKIQRTILC